MDDQAPQKLTVFYDGHCVLCRKVRDWLRTKKLLIPLELVDMRSAVVRERYSSLEQAFTAGRLVVLADDGRVYFDAKAKIMVLYATEQYRALSYELSTPLLCATAERIFAAVSGGRMLFGIDETCSDGVCRNG